MADQVLTSSGIINITNTGNQTLFSNGIFQDGSYSSGVNLLVSALVCLSEAQPTVVQQTHKIAVVDSFAQSVSDIVLLMQTQSLSVLDIASMAVSEAINIQQTHDISISEELSSHIINGLTITQGAVYNAILDDVSSQVEIGQVEISQAHNIGIITLTAQAIAEAAIIKQQHALTQQAIISGGVINSAILEQVHILYANDSAAQAFTDNFQLLGIGLGVVHKLGLNSVTPIYKLNSVTPVYKVNSVN